MNPTHLTSGDTAVELRSRFLDLTMDGRDSTAAPSSNRDASSDSDDLLFSLSVALAKDAALHFQSAKFAECVDVLNQLLSKKPNDPKVHQCSIAFTLITTSLL